jgi:hypothetical protein
MDQSGKVVLFGSAGLSVAALLGVSAFIVLHSPFWSRLGPGGGAVAPPDPMVVAASAMAKLVAGPVPGAGAPGAGASEGAADAAPATPPPA